MMLKRGFTRDASLSNGSHALHPKIESKTPPNTWGDRARFVYKKER